MNIFWFYRRRDFYGWSNDLLAGKRSQVYRLYRLGMSQFVMHLSMGLGLVISDNVS